MSVKKVVKFLNIISYTVYNYKFIIKKYMDDKIEYNVGDIVTIKNKHYEILYIYDIYYMLKSLSDNSTILLFEHEFTKTDTDSSLQAPEDITIEYKESKPINNPRILIGNTEYTYSLAYNLINHIGEKFYCKGVGTVTLANINLTEKRPITLRINDDSYSFSLYNDGQMSKNGECILQPLEDKTWAEFFNEPLSTMTHLKNNKLITSKCASLFNDGTSAGSSLSERKAVALMKIMMLLDKGYGGYITYNMYKSFGDNRESLYTIGLDPNTDTYIIMSNFKNDCYRNIIFRSYNDAQRFLSFEENIHLLDDLFGK